MQLSKPEVDGRQSRAQADGYCCMKDPGHGCYNDLDEQARNHWVSELRPTPTDHLTSPLTNVAYMHHPVSYLFCTNDAALDISFQRTMVAGLEKNGVQVHIETCAAGHSPFLSMPERILELVDRMLT